MIKYLKPASAGILVLLLAGTAGAQGPGVIMAGDLWETYLPTNVGKTYYEVETDPNQLYYLFRVGNLDRQWTTPTQMYPGGENIHIPWKQALEMIEYSPGINNFTTSSDPRAKDYVYAFQTPALGSGTADDGARWVDPGHRHQMIYEGSTPTNIGVDVKYRIRQWSLNHANMNDFLVLELELTNTGVFDPDGDGNPEQTGRRIEALVLNLRNELINSMSNSQAGRRGAAGWFTGPVSGYDATPDADGNPWDVPVTFTGPAPSQLSETGPDGIPWAPNGSRELGNTMRRRHYYYDIYTGSQWMAVKEGALPGDGSSFDQPDKKTIFDSHPVGTGAERGWYTSVSKGYGNNDHNPWENHVLSMGTFYENGGRISDRTAFVLRPDPNYFDATHPDIVEGNPLSFVAAVKPEGERGQPRGDMKYNGTFAQNWEKGNAGALPDGSDSDWDAGYTIGHGFDGDHYVGVGPFSLEVGETINITMAEYGGFRLQGVRRARSAAQWAYENNWQVPAPPPTPDIKVAPSRPDPDLNIEVKWDDRAESAADFAGYKIYRSTPFPRVDTRQLGIRMLDRYHEQTEANPSDAQLAAFGRANNPNISSDAYRDQEPNAWGPYRLIANIPAGDLGSYMNDGDDSGNYNYKFTDDSDLVSFGFTYYYYVAAYDDEQGEINGWPYTSLETHRNNVNGASGSWEGTYWWTTANAFYPDPNYLNSLKDIGAPFILKAPLADAGDLMAGNLAIRVLPNPYKRQALHDTGEQHKILFINLPTGTEITILDVSGQVIDVLRFDGTNEFDGTLFWDMFSKDGIEVTSGLYIYVAEYPGGKQTGHFAILQ